MEEYMCWVETVVVVVVVVVIVTDQ